MKSQPAEEIVHGIEATRMALDEKLAQLDARVRRAISWRQQIAQHPWKWLGGAVAAGFVLGWRYPKQLAMAHAEQSLANPYPAGHGGRRVLRFMLVSAVVVLSYETLRPYVLRQMRWLLDRWRLRGRQLTTATNTSWSSGAGVESLGFDSPPIESSHLSNPEVAGVEHAEPYYPPGGAADGRSLGASDEV